MPVKLTKLGQIALFAVLKGKTQLSASHYRCNKNLTRAKGSILFSLFTTLTVYIVSMSRKSDLNFCI